MRVEADLDSGPVPSKGQAVRRNDGWVRDGYPVSSKRQAVRWNDGWVRDGGPVSGTGQAVRWNDGGGAEWWAAASIALRPTVGKAARRMSRGGYDLLDQ